MKSTFFLTLGVAVVLFAGIVFISPHEGVQVSPSVQSAFLKELLVPKQAPADPMREAGSKNVYISPLDYEAAVVHSIEENAPAVISIIVSKDLPVIERRRVNPFGDLPPEIQDLLGPFDFGIEEPVQRGTRKQEIGGGSGFIVSADGLVVTNKHVVADKDADYTVLTNDGKKYEAEVLARDPLSDLAIIKIKGLNGKTLTPAKIGNSDEVRLGQTAIAIGNALGEFRNTISVGVISGLSRNITASGGGVTERIEGLIQTDAAINPGNSGGPLLNLKGEVIGINTAVAQGAENIGFAIPINRAKRDIESVKKTGAISNPYLGVCYATIASDLVVRDKLPVDAGAIVKGSENCPAVIPDSPAAKAGIKAEDIIIKINQDVVDNDHALGLLIQKYSVGDAISVHILRDGKPLILRVVLEERKES